MTDNFNFMGYTCNSCKAKVDYGDWFPISMSVHWCRDCITIHFDDIPDSEKERARRWRDGDWQGWGAEK